jgi:hypothetical protein
VNVDKTVDRTTVPLSASISNNTNLSSPERVPVSVTTEKVTSENATATIVTNNSFILFNDGSKEVLNRTQNAKDKLNATGFLPNTLLSKNREVRLLSISALFGLLGGTVSGINSLLNRRIWDSGKYVSVRRILYNYYSRPWIAMSVGIVTYVTLRAGLLNVGTAGNISVISEYGVAAIAALVGLMTDEIILRFRDIFRTLFGIASLERQQELQLSMQKNSIVIEEQTPISAILTDMRPTDSQNLIAYFFIQDPSIVQMIPNTKRDEKFTTSGAATVTIQGLKEGKTYITVMLSGDSDLYDKKEIKVEKRPTEHNQPDANTVSSSPNSSEVENSDIVKKSTVSSSSNSKNHH